MTKHVSRCTPCQIRHRKCDGGQVCQSCVTFGCSELCNGGRKSSGDPTTKRLKSKVIPREQDISQGFILDVKQKRSGSFKHTARPTPIPLTAIENGFLLRHFVESIAPWMDLFDEDSYFGRYVPQMAYSSEIVLSATTTYAAKRLARTRLYPYERAVQICDNCMHLIAACLMSEDEAVLAAVTILSGSELCESHGTEWSSHLDGLHALTTQYRLNGSCGGLRQRVFWIYAREDTLAALMTQSKVRLDPIYWSVSLNPLRDDEKGNASVYLLARAVNFLNDGLDKMVLEDLTEWRKFAFTPLVDSEKDGLKYVFYPTTIQASAMQMYHLANFLLKRDMIYHGHQIIGISNSGMKEEGRIQSVQPLYYVGLFVVDSLERRFVLEELTAIETQLGWGTRYRTDALLDSWGGKP